MTNTVVLFSSSRRNGNTGKLLDYVIDWGDAHIIDLATFNINEYDYEHKNIDDDFLPLIKKVLTYDKIIFASPVYWYAVTPTMKIFLDRISDLLDIPDLLNLGRQLKGKKAYVLSTSVSREISSSFINCFKDTFNYLGMEYCGYVHANCSDGYDAQEYEDDVHRFVGLLN